MVETEKWHIAPINIISDIEDDTLIIDNLYLQKVTKEELNTFWTIVPKQIWYQFSECNYKIVNKNLYNDHYFNFDKTIRIIKLGSSGISAQKLAGGSAPIYQCGGVIPFCPLLPPTEINLNDIDSFKKLFNKISTNKDKKFKLMVDKYIFATSGLLIPNGNRFIDLVTILEMLYSPSKEEQLRFRVSLAIAKMFEKHKFKINENNINETTKEKFKSVRNLYDIRSKLVHSGESKDLTKEKIKLLADIARKSLLHYLDNPKQFEQDNLLSLICGCPDEEYNAGQIATSG